MDNRLVLTVVFVAMCWMFVGSYAQSSTMATSMTTAAGTTVTHASMATGMTNMTAMAPNNMTNATMATNMTMMAPNNMTNATMATNTTTMAPAAAPLVTNTTVVPLVQNVTNSGCGTQQFCGSQPASCNPNVAGECFFVATRRESGRNFGFDLSGESEGFLAATLSTDSELGGNDTTYVCANNNGTIQFFGARLINGQLNRANLPVNNVKGRVNGRRIQCTFSATLPEQRNRAENFVLGIATGPFNISSGELGAPNFQFRAPAANIADPNTNVTNVVNATMATNMTTMAPNNMTNATMATNMTTMAPNNMTNATMATNMTTMAPAAAPLVTNTTVVPLVQNITNSGCGTEQFCASQPVSCNPNVAGGCFFVATRRENLRNFGFDLSGESEGFLSFTLSTDNQLGGNDTTYVCANNNGTIQFFGARLDNDRLTVAELPVNNVKGRVNGRRIQCTFSATLPEQSNRAENFAYGIATGPFSNGELGSPTFQLRANSTNIANPNSTATNSNTTPATTTPAGTTPASNSPAIALQQSLTQALLITVAVLSLALL